MELVMVSTTFSPPLAITIRIVTAMSVMPDNGDQFVRPMHSATTTPATQTHKVPSNAMAAARPSDMFSTDV